MVFIFDRDISQLYFSKPTTIIAWWKGLFFLLIKNELYCMKSVRIQSYSGPYFPAFELTTVRYSVSLRIQSECGKIQTRITPNGDTFYAVLVLFTCHNNPFFLNVAPISYIKLFFALFHFKTLYKLF